MKRLIVCILLLFGTQALQAEGNGGFAGSYLRIGLGGQNISMGNAGVAAPPNGYSYYYNPAGLPYLEDFSANLSYSFMSLDRRFNVIGISTPLEPNAGFALGWVYAGVGDLKSYNSIGQETGSIDHGMHAFYFSFGLQIVPNRVSVGISAKYLLEKISDEDFDYKGSGVGGDLGVQFIATDWLRLGYQLKDIKSKLKSNTDEIFDRGMVKDNEFPISNRLGAYMILPWKWWRLAYDFEWSDAGEEKHHFGTEFVLPQVRLATGYDNDHFTFGAGFEMTTAFNIRASLNYAFVNSVVDEGASHVFSWQFKF